MTSNQSVGYRRILGIYGAIIVLVLLSVLPWFPWLENFAEYCDGGVSYYGLSLILCWYEILFIVFWKKISGRFFDAISIYGGIVWLFNGGGLAIARIMVGSANDVLLFDWFYSSYMRVSDQAISHAMLIVMSALSFYYLGASLVVLISKQQPSFIENSKQTENKISCSLRVVGSLLIAVSFVPYFLILYRSFLVVGQQGYMGLFSQSASIRGAVGFLASGFVPGCFYLFSGISDQPYLRKLISIFLVFSVMPYLMLGDRGLVFSLFLAFGLMWHRCVRPIKLSHAVLLGFALCVFSRLLFIVRVSNPQIISVSDIFTFNINSITALTDTFVELGSSLVTLAYTVDLVPYSRDYEYGMTYVYAFLAAIPNIFFFGFENPKLNRVDEATWLINVVAPKTAARGGGLGYSIIAECYLNFGRYWGELSFGFLGCIISQINEWSYRTSSKYRAGFVAALLFIILLSARGESLMIVRRTIYLVAIPAVAVELLKKTSLVCDHRE